MNTIKEKIIKFIKKEVGSKSAIVNLSGGLDSAVVAFLAVEAIGKEKVHTLYLPSETNTREDLKLSELVANLLETQHEVINIDNLINEYKKCILFGKSKKNIGNLKARIRMSIAYAYANEKNALVIGTGNKSEILTGYFTKFGDSAADILPIGDLLKTQVKELAIDLKIPQAIINRQPTAGLWLGQTDENELGITYKNLDAILKAIENKKLLNHFDQGEVELVKKYISRTQHKRRLPKVCKI